MRATGAVPAAGPVVGFDLDMTLVDSAAGIAATLRAALAEHNGGDPGWPTDAQCWPYVGIPLETVAAELAPDADPQAVARRYRQLYPQVGVPSIRLLPGAAEAVAAVHDVGGRVVVVSAKIESAVRAVLDQVGLGAGPDAVDAVVGGLFGGEKGTALRSEGAAVYVGDHVGDVAAARAGGTVAVAVATGPCTADELRAAGADVVLPDLRAWPGWWREWSVRSARAAADPPGAGKPVAPADSLGHRGWFRASPPRPTRSRST